MFCTCLILHIFCIFCLVNTLQKVFENFSHSSSFLILAQILAPFDCLDSFWCKLSWKFSVTGLNFDLKFSGKFLSLYLDLFSCRSCSASLWKCAPAYISGSSKCAPTVFPVVSLFMRSLGVIC